jgi:hypothetical protein
MVERCDECVPRHLQPAARIVARHRMIRTAMPSLSQVLARLRKASRQSRPTSLRVPALILRRVTWHRMSFSEPLVCSGVSGRSKHHQQLVFVGMQSCQQAVERDEAGAAQKDAVEPGAQRDRPALTPRIRRAGSSL